MAKTAAITKKEAKPYTKRAAKVATQGSRQSTRTPTAASIEKAKASKAAAESGSESEEEEEVVSEEEEKTKKTKKAPAVKKEKKEPAAKAKSAGTGIGEVVADVTLMNEAGEETSLESLYTKSGLVIFSYPKANTPGCTNQACGFRDIHDEITALGYQVVGLSQDTPKAQLSWKTGKNLPYSFLCDPSRKLLKVLGATEAKKRCHWVIEKGGKLLEADIGVKPKDDPANALKFIQNLK